MVPIATGIPIATRRYDVLDSLRGVCACMVALYHFQGIGLIGRSALVQHGFLFVDFFFVLSGLVISRSYAAKLRHGFPVSRFMLLRLGRTYPLHAVMMFVYLAYHIVAGVAGARLSGRGAFDPPDDIGNFLINLFLIQIFAGPPGVFWNIPSWSIVAETWTYLIFAPLFRFAGRTLVPIVAGVAIAAPLYLLFRGDPYIAAIHDGALVRSLFGFAVGVIAAALVDRASLRLSETPMIATWCELATGAAVILFVCKAGAGPWSLLAPFLFLAAVLVFAAEAGLVSRLLGWRPFVVLGTLSYSIYMIHFFIQDRFFSALKVAGRIFGQPSIAGEGSDRIVGLSPLFADAMSLVMLAVVVGAAALSFRLIERPMQRWSRRKILGRHSASPALLAEVRAPTF